MSVLPPSLSANEHELLYENERLQKRIDELSRLLTVVRKETWREAIKAAQQSAQKSENAGLSITSAEILIRRLENAAAAPPALAAHSVKENETDEETNTR